MDEKEFYMEAFDNLPALADNSESVKETFSHVFYEVFHVICFKVHFIERWVYCFVTFPWVSVT